MPAASDRKRSVLLAAAVALATIAGGFAFGRAGVPSSYLFAAILAGLTAALAAPRSVYVPRIAFRAAQAVTGVALGTYLRSSTLATLGSRWAAVLAVSGATLAVSIGAGLALARATGLDRPTASLGMVAGGASGIVAIADELGGDDRLVAFMQYLRVLIIVLLTPVLVRLGFHQHAHGPATAAGSPLGTPAGWTLTLLAAPLGALAAVRLRIPAASLLGPLLATGALTVAGVTGAAQVPPLLRETAFAAIGLQVGLGFDVDTLRRIARLLVPVLVAIAAIGVACFGLAEVLTATTHVSLLNTYLATTPGGLYAVLATAFGSGADTTFVLAVQGLRLLVMIVAAPAVVRWLVRSAPGAARPAAAPD